MNIIKAIKEWIRKMLSKADISSMYGIDLAVTDSMLNAIEEWNKMYLGKGFWTDHKKGIYSLRLEQAIVREFSNISVNEMMVKISNKRLDEIFSNAVRNLNLNLQKGLATGAMIIKPLGEDKVQYVSQSQFIPIEYDVNGRLIKVIFPEVKRIGDNDYRIRLEYHSLDYKTGLTITNRAFHSLDGISLGKEISLSDVSEWAKLLSEVSYPLMLRPAFGYYVNPIDNTVDGSCSGVSIFDSAKKLIQLSDIQFGRLDWEFESGERAIDVDEIALKPITDSFTGKRRMEMPKLKERLFRGLNISGGAGKDFYNEFSPQLRQADFIAGLEAYKREIEFAVGLSYGDISNPQTVDKTATEIKSSKQRKFNMVTAIQSNLKICLEDLCYALAFYNKLTQSGYEISINFEDSILADDEVKRTSDRQDVAMGIMPLWEYRMKWYGEDEKTAKAMTSNGSAEVIE
ncbi:MAG: hypothetical protein ACLS5A_04000 [Pseudoruminococcus massiliensis]|uniref:hypothetical protein n=1 Tax=Pseudoruminococcus massiliensis TaxID=2086583 RepID=UPI003991FCD4